MTSAPVKLPRARLRQAGADRFNSATWATRLALAALVVSAGWVLWSAARPLPQPELDRAPAPPVIAPPRAAGPTLAQRDSLLAKLNEEGNIFAPDRRPWSVHSASRDAGDSSAGSEAAHAGSSPRQNARAIVAAASAGKPVRYQDIPIEKKPPIAINKELKDLRLRGVYRAADGPVAMIGNIRQADRNHTEPRRVGDTFDKGKWTVLAIDDASRRVILSRAGVNVELRLYNDAPGVARAAPAPTAAAAPQLPNPSVVVHTRTAEQIRQAMLAAGLSGAQIDELLALVSQDSSDKAAVGKTPSPAPDPLAGAPKISPGMAELLKMMAANTAPGAPAVTTPAPKQDQNPPSKEDAKPADGG